MNHHHSSHYIVHKKYKMNNKIWLSLAKMSGNEQKYVQEAFDTNWVVPLGPNVNAFEESLSTFLNAENAKVVALSAGTAALHLSLIMLGVKHGDEVICQSFTFCASANPITYLGATPVFVDSETDTWNMSPAFLEEAIKDRIEKTGNKPKAIIPVHLYGMPAKMDKIMEIANKYEIPVVEDAAEALGSEYKGQKCGTFGQYGVLSFNGNKIITTSGGGALVCHSRESASKVMFYATQARENAPYYQHEEIGYNYRMSNICAGIGRGQMTMLTDFINHRRRINTLYLDKLSYVNGITVMESPSEEFYSNYWLSCILIDEKKCGYNSEDLRIALDVAGIESRPLWRPLHLQPVFKSSPFYGDGTSEKLFEKGLCIPSGVCVTDEDVDRIVEIIKTFRK